MQLGCFRCVLLVAACVQGQDLTSIVDTAVADGRFKVLVKALNTTNINSGFLNTRVTLFAPTDQAFMAAGITEELLSKDVHDDFREELVSILTYHIMGGEVKSSDLTNGMEADTWHRNAKLSITIDEQSKAVKVNTATVTTADIMCSNGVIHVVDQVLLPPSHRDANGVVLTCKDYGASKELCLQQAPRCIFGSVPQAAREGLLVLFDEDQSGTLSPNETKPLEDESVRKFNFGDYDKNGDGELDMTEAKSMLEITGFQGCCKNNPDPCSASYGADAEKCTAEWLYPGCCHVAEKGCVSYHLQRHFQHLDNTTCSAPASTEQCDGSLVFSAKRYGPLGQREDGGAALFASSPEAKYAIQGCIAELANVGLTRVKVKLASDKDTSFVNAEFAIAIPEGRDGATMASKLERSSSANGKEYKHIKQVCTEHIIDRRLSYDIEVAKITASVKDEKDEKDDEGAMKDRNTALMDAASSAPSTVSILPLTLLSLGAFLFACE